MSIRFKSILVPVDFSECSRRALAQAIELAARFEGEVTALHVYEPPYAVGELLVQAPGKSALSVDEYMRTSAQGLFDQLVTEVLATTGVDPAPPLHTRLVSGMPTEVILEEVASLEPDVLVMGTHGRKGLAHLMLGSVAERVIRRAACPVLVVR